MPKRKRSPEGEVIAAYGAAMVAAFQVLINYLSGSVTFAALASVSITTCELSENSGLGWRFPRGRDAI